MFWYVLITTVTAYAMLCGTFTFLAKIILFPGRRIAQDDKECYVALERNTMDLVPLVIVLHGRNETAYEAYLFWQKIRQMFRCDLYVPEYAGYGIHSHMDISASTMLNQLRLVWQQIVLLQKHQRPVYLIGQDVGTGLVLQLSEEFPSSVDALVLISPYSSLRQIVIDRLGKWVSPFLWLNYLINEQTIARVRVPKLIIHGTEDDFIAPYHCQILKSHAHPMAYCNVTSFAGHLQTMTWNKVLHRIVQYLTVQTHVRMCD